MDVIKPQPRPAGPTQTAIQPASALLEGNEMRKRLIAIMAGMALAVPGCLSEWIQVTPPTPCENCCDGGVCIPLGDVPGDVQDWLDGL